MKPLRLRDRTTLALLLAVLMLAGGCGSWNLDPGVLVQSLPLDLAFGRDLSETPAPAATPEPAEEPPLKEKILNNPAFDKVADPPIFKSKDPCPEADPLATFPDRAPETSTPPNFPDPAHGLYAMKIDEYVLHTDQGDIDIEQELRTRFSLSKDDPLTVVREILARKGEVTPKRGLSYSARDLARLSEIRFLNSAIDEDPVGPPGFHFQELSFFIPDEDSGTFTQTVIRPQNPLLLIEFPLIHGRSTNARVQEVEVYQDDQNKIVGIGRPNVRQGDPVAEAPAQGGPAAGSGTVATSEATVLPADQNKDRLFGCGQAVDTARLRWKLSLAGQFNTVIEGTWWVAPQYGGYPFREEIEITTDVFADQGIRGMTFGQSFMFVDPVVKK